MSLSDVKQDLVSIITSIEGVACSYDYSTIEESAKSVVIDSLELTYQHDLDMGWHKEFRAVAVLITKTPDDLDALVDAFEALDNTSEGSIRDIMLESMSVENNDLNMSIATAVLSGMVWENVQG